MDDIQVLFPEFNYNHDSPIFLLKTKDSGWVKCYTACETKYERRDVFMAAITVDIAPAILSWVINNTSLLNTDDNLYTKVTAWISGEKKPTFNQIETLSKKTHVPLGYFFLKNPPVENLPILEYRTVNSTAIANPSRDIIDTVYYLESTQEWMREYLKNSGVGSIVFVASQKGVFQPMLIANAIRNEINLNIDWYSKQNCIRDAFNNLRRLLSKSGIMIMMSGIVGSNTHRKLDIEEFRAITLLDEIAPVIFINSNDTLSGKLFSLMHEAAHIWVGENSFFNDRFNNIGDVSQTERLCNAVAAEILVPNELFIEEWKGTIKKGNPDNAIKQLARLFNCGVTIIARRALDNNFILQDQYLRIAKEAIQSYIDSQTKHDGGGDYYKTNASRLDHNLIIAIDNSLKEGTISFTDAYRLTNTSRKTFPLLVEKVRFNDYVG
jgi:Zn-dependent peptidase ImmA (M78 family)